MPPTGERVVDAASDEPESLPEMWSLVAGFKVRKIGHRQFYVKSRTDPHEVYLFDAESIECSCWAFLNRKRCPHTAHLAPHLVEL